MNKKLIALVTLLVIMGVIGFVQVTRAVSLPTGTALFETSLQSRISSTDTSMTLVANSVRGSQSISGYNCFTIDEGRSDSEYVCGTVSGTAVTSLERGLSFTTGTTSITALQFAHRKGADVKITDFPLLQRIRNQNNGGETYPNLMSYANTVLIGVGSPTSTLATKYYVDSVAVAGASNADETTKGISELATQIEMASSTLLGSTGAALTLQARYSTSSPYTAGLWNVITQNDGKIHPNFIATSSAYTYNFAASTTFSGKLLATATTTIAASGTSSAPLVLNSVPYAFPSSNGVSSSTLSNDGAGNLTWVGNSYRLLTQTTAPSTNQGATTTVFSLTIPANSLSTANYVQCLASGSGINVANSDTVWIDVSYGGVSTSTIAVTQASGSSKSSSAVTFILAAAGATNSQVFTLNGPNFNATNIVLTGTFSTDSTAAKTLLVRAKNGTGGASSQWSPEIVTCTLNR